MVNALKFSGRNKNVLFRNGVEFEQRIKQNEINNPKFNFLSPGDPYNAYYQHRVVQIREGKVKIRKIILILKKYISVIVLG